MQAENSKPENVGPGEERPSRSITLKSFADLKEAQTLRQIHAFADQLRKGIDNWRTAGTILVELARSEPDIFKKIQAIYPQIATSTLETFMRIGRKEIWPPLLADSSFGARRLLECNYSLQKKYAEEPIEVATHWSGDKIRSVKKMVNQLTRSEAAIVFDGNGGINNLEQQAFRLPSAHRSPLPAAPVKAPMEYKAPRKKNVDLGYFSLTIHQDGTITCIPCGRSPIAQPVLVEAKAGDLKSAIVLCYKRVVE